MLNLEINNEISILSTIKSGVWRIDLLNIESNNLYPILCTVTYFETYVVLIFNINEDYENGLYNYEITNEDITIETGMARFGNSNKITRTEYKSTNTRKIYE